MPKLRLFSLTICVIFCAIVLAGSTTCFAQAVDTAPVVGLQEHRPTAYAIVGGTIVTEPGKTLENTTLLVRDGRVQQVGQELEVPEEYEVIDATGKTVYAGFIDSWSDREVDSDGSSSGYWNRNIKPESHVLDGFEPTKKTSQTWRTQGFVARLIAPQDGQIKGTGAVVTCGEGPLSELIVHPQATLHVSLTANRRGRSEKYPSSPMGAVALVRQAFYDADWYAKARKMAKSNPKIQRPATNEALAALVDWNESGRPVVVDTSNERYFARADRLGNEFGLPVIVRGSGREYRRLDDVIRTGRPILLPVDFPKAPAVGTPADAATATLISLMHWDLAPENPGRLVNAGAIVALTTDGLEKKSKFWSAIRKAVGRGLDKQDALASLTTIPAKLFDVEDQLGTIQVGKAAHFVIASGDLFTDRKAKVEETWIDGTRYRLADEPDSDLSGTWRIVVDDKEVPAITLRLKGKPGRHSGTIAAADADQKDRVKIKQAQKVGSQFSFLWDGEKLDKEGFIHTTLIVVEPIEEGTTLQGRGLWPDGTSFRLQATKQPQEEDDSESAEDAEDEDEEEAEDEESDEESEPNDDDGETTGDPTDEKIAPEQGSSPPAEEEDSNGDGDGADDHQPALFAVNYPLGAFGREKMPPVADRVAFTNATIWTCGPEGVLKNATIVLANGKIESVSTNVEPPAEAEIIDAAGKHISPGIIDCHSHIATDGGVNEGTQAITCEVRIGDFIDMDDISIYRQLAGGVTSANILHGSANPIGGQNQVIKMRWGANSEGGKFRLAPPGVKFALGENVKQSNWGDDHTSRYPQTRMGVDEVHIDAFERALAYRKEWADWKVNPQGLPPRYDLELEALAEIVEGTRWIHCHSYRQSEIMALMRTCDRFGITIGTFQHILEGYKVADEMAQRGIMGSAFSDWWAYKFEVYDAIPFAGALMHNAGVIVSFNSDDAEMGRRLNVEAAKAMRYGGLSPEDALNFVTINPAKQLRIDKHVGSLETGKQADLVVWNKPPLSVYAVCEQTWIDGRRMFDIGANSQLQQRDRERHAALVQKVIRSEAEQRKPGEDDKNDDDLWARSDTYCHGHEHGHDE